MFQIIFHFVSFSHFHFFIFPFFHFFIFLFSNHFFIFFFSFTRSHKQRRQDRICPPLPTPRVTTYRSDGACRGQGTIAETLAGWGAAVWLADDRGLGAGVAFATALGFLGNTIKLNTLLFSNVCFVRFVCRILTLFLMWTL